MVEQWLKNRLGTIFIVAGVVGFVVTTYITHRPLNGLNFLVLVAFLWLSCYRQRLAYAVALVAVYLILSLPLVMNGWMDSASLLTLLMVTTLVVLALSMQWLNFWGAIIAIAIFWGVIIGLYVFEVFSSTDVLAMILGSGVTLLMRFAVDRSSTDP